LIIEQPAWCQPSALLDDLPILVRGNAGGKCLWAAVLNDAGQELLLTRGRVSTEAALIEACIDPERRESFASVPWAFFDASLIGADRRDDFLAEALSRRGSPRLPDVVARHQQDRKIRLLFHVPADLVWFEGHFPGDPILPAVVQIDWVIHFGREFGFSDASFTGFSRLKFMSVITPDAVIRLILVAETNGIQFTYESGSRLHSKGVVLFDDEPQSLTRQKA
jgi:3-hydroxymyristoyl/3-hydroxydecanoyl-(acyl carrier protein) dehydratase